MAIDNPGLRLQRWRLSEPVIACEAAASAKGIDLEHELKSLLLKTGHGPMLVHIRGDQHLSLRAVKRFLEVDQAFLASPAELRDLGLAPGAVHPFAPRLWESPQLIAREVLRLNWVTTNAGESTSYVVFDPQILLRAPAVSVGDFER
ncbi:MAG TPA: YbaK/EbsC family protein [Solirubrobacteraceae bacterium]|jgi:prolyl-tRNA editing enzyme YbaK/EbsC (Cys-tRNA(Pro) deacylase)|nr:YbaK/EbsC family protein [Solirubrobacteraceae bacterium]